MIYKLLIFILICSSLPAKENEFGHNLISMGKWQQISERGMLRVLVSPSRTNFFIANQQLHGFEFEMLELFKKHIRKTQPKFRINYIPVPHDQLIPRLLTGHGDIAVSLLTITPERKRLVDFSQAYLTNVKEVLVVNKNAPEIKSINALSTKTVLVTGGSPYIKSLIKINQSLAQQKLPPINIQTLNGGSSEDVLELVNLKVYDYCVVDDTLAKLWDNNLMHININQHVTIARGKQYAWALRKNSPLLKQQLNNFIKTHAKGSLMGNIIYKKYYQNNTWLRRSLLHQFHYLNPYKKFFQEAAQRYQIDPRLLAALSFQESRFNPDTQSHAGAIGLMQLMPATARELGVKNLRDPYQSIMGGSKYLHQLIARYAKEPQVNINERIHFALAAYNAGFGNLRHWRKRAKEAGYNPNIWFDHVDKFAPKETYIYVFNITRSHQLVGLYHDTLLKQAQLKKSLSKAPRN